MRWVLTIAVLVSVAAWIEDATASSAQTNATPPSISSFSQPPPLTKPLASGLRRILADDAGRVGFSETSALQHVRLLRSNVTGLPLYAKRRAEADVRAPREREMTIARSSITTSPSWRFSRLTH